MSAMASHPVTRTAIIGCGGMARNHIRNILEDPRGTSIDVVCEPMAENYEATAQLFANFGHKPPPNVPDLQMCLDQHRQDLDAVFIVTPHSMHYDHCVMCLDAGLEVLVEKPMVVNQTEARQLMAKQQESGKLLVVAFQGSLSPRIRWAAERIQDGTFGELRSISRHCVAELEHVGRWQVAHRSQGLWRWFHVRYRRAPDEYNLGPGGPGV